MHDYLLSSEWVRFAFILGVAVSMVMYEKRHLTTGSIVVPGYIAVFIIHPLVIVATFLNALVTYAIVNKVLRRYFLLYGRTKFTVLAVISTGIQTLMLRATPSGAWLWESDIPLFIGVGYIVPGLIAHDMARQGIKKTITSVLMAGTIVAIPIAIAIVLNIPGVNDLAPVAGFGSLAISLNWLPFAVILSVLASWAVAHNYNLRSGGFVGAAFIGMFMADPWQVAVALVIATATYLIVAKFLMRHMILFGRRKFSSMLLVSSILAWSGLWVGDRFLNATWEQHLGVGSLALTPLILPGLLANDAQRTSPPRVALGLMMASTFVVSTTWWVESTVVHAELHPGWKLLALIGFVVLFAKQLAVIGRYVWAPIARFGSTVAGAADTAVAAIRPVLVETSSLTVATAGPTLENVTASPWEAWSTRHPDAASDAEAWLDAELNRTTADTSTASRGNFDAIATSVLETALHNDRGSRRTPRPQVPPIYRDDRPRLSLTEISETSDAQWEAQPGASGVSATNSHDPGADITTGANRPTVDF